MQQAVAEGLQQQLDALLRIFDDVPGAAASARLGDGLIRSASDGELLESLRVAGRLNRLVEAQIARLAGEVARRSPTGPGALSLARRMGQRSSAAHVAHETGGLVAEAARQARVGKAVRPREALTGQPLPASRPALADAVGDGCLPLAVAAAIDRCLSKVDRAVAPDQREGLERQVVDATQQGWSAEGVLSWLQRVPDHVDPDGALPREQAIRANEEVSKRLLSTGTTRYVLDLSPVNAGFFDAALEADDAFGRVQLTTSDEEAQALRDRRALDDRTPGQRRADAVGLMAKKALATDDGQVGGTAVTMLVTIDEQALRTGLGSAAICGVDQPISAATARRLAAAAELVPVVLGGDSRPLDLSASVAASSPPRSAGRWPLAALAALARAARRRPPAAMPRTSDPPGGARRRSTMALAPSRPPPGRSD